MRAYWSDTRPNGKPVEPGTFCWITDLEDGSHPIATYGASQEEVLQKLASQNANAQLELARRSARPVPGPTTTPAPRRMISPDEVMQATADLSNPAKSGHAIATLFESATGVNPQRLVLQHFSTIADQWEQDTPDFYPHSGNKRLIATEAAQLAGGLGQVTAAHLNQAFNTLRARGELFEAPAPPDGNHLPSSTFPDQTQVQRPAERPRPRFATSARSNGFRSQAPTRTLRYTEEEIRTMPLSKSRRLIDIGDPDYAAACEAYYGSSQPTA